MSTIEAEAVRIPDYVRQYVATLLWSTNDESTPAGGEPLDKNYDIQDLAPESLQKCIDDCERFRELAGDMIDEHSDRTQWAHDFWLTRNGHGAGFWDGDWPENGDKLTELAEQFGEVWPYIGDDGKIYV